MNKKIICLNLDDTSIKRNYLTLKSRIRNIALLIGTFLTAWVSTPFGLTH